MNTRKWTRLLALITFLAVVALFFWMPYYKAYELVHPMRRPIVPPLEFTGIDNYENVSFPSPDGLTLRGWYIPPKNNAVIIFVHGLGGNRTEYIDYIGFITEAGYGALLFDLRNSGESDGTITSLGLYEARDVQGAVKFVQQKAGEDTHIILMGHSMGAATVLLAAPDIPAVDAVIIESAYTSVSDNVADSVYVLTNLPAFPFAPLIVFFGEHQSGLKIGDVRPIDSIAHISPRPLLLIHGDQDRTILVKNSYALYDAAQEPKELYIIQGAGHGNLYVIGGETYQQRILDFLTSALRKR
jgi:uncharacterized protein